MLSHSLWLSKIAVSDHGRFFLSRHLCLYSAFNNTDCAKAALQYQIGK